ncbi:hypothetical protein AHiyo8_60910 [Arthrobacter sp. Hiyo8]|nr:hypothetical protein AHiyo8_60910 [Arthrobacter sp. Hiyo8]
MRCPAFIKAAVSRAVALFAIVVLIGLLPWLSGHSPEYTILRPGMPTGKRLTKRWA